MIFGPGLKTKKILKRDSGHRDKKAIIFDGERLAYLFRIYNQPVSAEFNVTNVTENDKPNNYINLDAVTSNGGSNGSDSVCYQANSSKESIYGNGNIGNIKNDETGSDGTIFVDEEI